MPPSDVHRSNQTRIDWITLAFIAGYHLLLFVTLPLYLLANTPNGPLIAVTVLLAVGSGLSITAGYHRLYSHRTYRASRPVEAVLLFFATLTAEGSVLRWAHDHRLHHRYVDTENDPYGTERGFWHSHLLWMFKQSGPMDERYIRDLLANRWLVLQDRYYGLFMTLANGIAVLLAFLISGDLFGAFVFAFLLRMFVGHHATWFINSLAHMWGSKPYSSEHSAVNNFILAFLTYGEGYHNYHHTFAGDYRNGVRWYQFDPSKYLIWTLSKLGLASDLKTTDPLTIKRRLVKADHELLIDHIRKIRGIDTSALAVRIERMSSTLSANLSSMKVAADRYQAAKRQDAREEVEELRERLRAMRRELRRDFREWNRMTRSILKMRPVVS